MAKIFQSKMFWDILLSHIFLSFQCEFIAKLQRQNIHKIEFVYQYNNNLYINMKTT